MPPEDGIRLGASIELFERVIEMEPDFMGGLFRQKHRPVVSGYFH